MVYIHNQGVIKRRISIASLLLLAGLFALLSSVGVFSSAKAASVPVNGCLFDQNVTTWTLEANCTSTAEIYLPNGVTLDGNGKTIKAFFDFTDYSNNAAIGVVEDNVTIVNLTIDGTGGHPYPLGLHGINVYDSTGAVINNVTVKNMSNSGIVINSSTVTVNNITTTGNGWNGINVDQKTSSPAILNIVGKMYQSDNAHIFLDDITKSVTVNDPLMQYTNNEFTFSGKMARLYTLKLQPKIANDCKKDGWKSFGFNNQGLCIQYVNTAKDSRVNN